MDAKLHPLEAKQLVFQNHVVVETAGVYRRLATVIRANGSIGTNEGATVYLRKFEIFVTAQLVDGTRQALRGSSFFL